MRVFSIAAGVLLLGVVLVGTGLGQQQQGDQAPKAPKQPSQVLRGGPGDDLIIGTEQREYIIGGSGEDVLRGGGGADVIEGGPGDDQIEGDSFEALYNLDDGESD